MAQAGTGTTTARPRHHHSQVPGNQAQKPPQPGTGTTTARNHTATHHTARHHTARHQEEEETNEEEEGAKGRVREGVIA